jgi:superfamily II DNA or RNA helicase
VIESLSKGEIRAAGACKGLTVGVTIPGVNCGVYAAYFSSRRNLSQRVGRTIRDATADIANNFYLVAKNTQQEEWLKNMLEDIDKDYIKYLKYEI